MNGAVITALNEAGTIAELVTQLKAQGLDVCVVNDGSTDDTGIVAGLAGAHVINHTSPMGIGKSLVEAWGYAIAQGWRYTLQIDAGGSHNPKDYRYFFGSVLSPDATISEPDLVIGSRFIYLNDYIGGSWIRKAGSKITARICNYITHEQITDWTSGYRMFGLSALRYLSQQNYITNGHTWQIEVLNCAVVNGFTINETPIIYRAGRSSMSLKTIDDLLKVLLWMFFQ